MNIPPSRARRQLAARLALHSKQNQSDSTTTTSSENGDKAEQQHRKNPNPFATEEDDDSDNEDDNERDFSIGDLDVEDDGRGLLAGGTEGGEDKGKNVNVGLPPASNMSSSNTSTTAPLGIGRASFPSMWPFGASSPTHKGSSNSGASFAVERGTEDNSNHEHDNESHIRGERSSANGNDVQSDESDSSNSSDEELGYGDRRQGRENEFGGDGQGKRRLSVTTEAKRRTSLEDDDDDEVVHVGLEVGNDVCVGGGREKGDGGGDDGELVEIQHAEMQGVEEGK